METWNFLVNHIGELRVKSIVLHLTPSKGRALPPIKEGFVEGEALCILRTNPTPSACSNNVQSFKICLKRGIEDTWRRCRETYVRPSREGPSKRKKMTYGKTIAIYGAISSGKNILMGKWHLIQNQRTESHRKGKSLWYMMKAEVKNGLRMLGVLEARRASILFNSSFASWDLHPARGVGRNNSSRKLRETTKLAA